MSLLVCSTRKDVPAPEQQFKDQGAVAEIDEAHFHRVLRIVHDHVRLVHRAAHQDLLHQFRVRAIGHAHPQVEARFQRVVAPVHHVLVDETVVGTITFMPSRE